MSNEGKTLKTGTTTIGVVCKDCIVLAADKRATAGHMVVDKKTNKIIPISKRFAITTAGVVSDAQLVTKLIKAQISLKENQTNRNATTKEIANMLSGMLYQLIRTPSMMPGLAHLLLGGFDKEPALYDIYPDGAITDVGEFVCSGSGSIFAVGVLENDFKKDMTQKDGIQLIKKAINASLKRDAMSGNGFNIAIIDKNGFKFVESGTINTGIY
jgi:proteasome beta subunit